MTDRRSFVRSALGASALGAVGSMLLPLRRALAAEVGGNQLKFVFVVNYGGWDPTRVLAPEFDNPNVDMERDAEVGRVGDLLFTDHAARPSVRSFFERHAARSLILKGMLSPSIAHENCLKWMMCGTTNETASDWPAILAAAQADTFALPHMVVAGPSFPGALAGVVTRTGTSGQLAGLMSGDILALSDLSTAPPSRTAEAVMDSYLRRRAAALGQSAATAREAAYAAAFEGSLGQAGDLKDLLHVMDWSSASSLGAQVRLAVDALSQRVSRCATISYSGSGWDTHVNNDTGQSTNWEGLFAGLVTLMDRLAASPGDGGGSLADETIVVVVSEMGRTPRLNANQGKDHWPYTSMLMTGPLITGGRVVGGYDDLYYGLPLDPESGEPDEGGAQLTTAAMGATLLQMCDIDPADYLAGTNPMPGILQ